MSTAAKAPPPPRKPAPTEEEKKEAANKIAAALSGGKGVTEKTGEVSAAAVKERAEANKPAAPVRVAAAPPSGKPKAEEAAPAPPTAGVDLEAVTRAIEAANVPLAIEVKAVSNVCDKLAAANKKILDQLQNVSVAVASALEVLPKILEAAQTQVSSAECRVEVRAVDHAMVRIMFSELPKEPEWIEEWSEKVAAKYDAPADVLAQLAREFGFVLTYEGENAGEAVCSAFDEPTGV